MDDSATTRMRFETPAPLALEAGRITSDGGLTWLAEVDRELAEHVPEWRGSSVRHSLLTLVCQRVFEIACGYEDRRTTPTPCERTLCSSWS